MNEGFKVIEAENGHNAIEKVEKNPDIDLIIMDIMMPKLDGYSACKEIFKTKKFQQLCFQHEKKNMINFLVLNLE